MKKLLSVLVVLALVTGFYSCEKEDNTTEVLCNNGIYDEDNGEVEYDCGGPCQACPDSAYLDATMGVTDYASLPEYLGGKVTGKGIRIYAQDSLSRYLDFCFIGGELNVPYNVVFGRFDYGENHTFGPGDTGHVTLTYLDTTRRIISGTFSYGATRDRSWRRAEIREGVFRNVRYRP